MVRGSLEETFSGLLEVEAQKLTQQRTLSAKIILGDRCLWMNSTRMPNTSAASSYIKSALNQYGKMHCKRTEKRPGALQLQGVLMVSIGRI